MPINWNIAVNSCSSNYFAMIHADDYYHKTFVKNINLYIEEADPDLVIFNAKIVNYKNEVLYKLKYKKDNLVHKTVLTSFPGVQRQIWKKNKLKFSFKNFLFPTFDYIWFYQNIQNIQNINYLNKDLIFITSDENQSTNNISWESGIIKSIFFVFVDFKNFKFKIIAIIYLFKLLKDHIYKRIYKPNLFNAKG